MNVKAPYEVYELLGVKLSPLTIAELNSLIEQAVTRRERVVITSQNVHGVYVYHRSAEMRALHDIAVPRIDGMPLVLLGRMFGLPFKREHRVTWIDWMDPLMAFAAARGWRVMYLGSRPGVAEAGGEILRGRHPTLQLRALHGYFDMARGSAENEAVLSEIGRYRPHILMVGMGMPRQEAWVLDNLDRLEMDGGVLTCGAAIDYIAGVVPTPPRWMGRVGLEWLYRLLSEPRRLAGRYLIEPWYLTGLLGREIWRRVRR